MAGHLKPRVARVVVLVAALAGVAVTTRLGLWQLDRAAQKQAAQAEIDARAGLAPLTGSALARDAEAASVQHHRPATVRGTWAAQHTVALDNRPLEGRAGFIVVTPLRLATGEALLVQRGWVPRDLRDPSRVPPVVTPAGEVRVQGLLAPPPSQLFELAAPASAPGPIRQNLDLAAFARETGLALLPITLQQTGPSDDDLVRRWPRVGSDLHKNRGYAVQWFALAALIAGLYVWFQLVRPRR